jgi:DNA-binding Xre family transcriptional regulator|tara:strand:+ start:3208 stop:3432 length:225 start_codon:yes stop_codon:yes gene_type:complete
MKYKVLNTSQDIRESIYRLMIRNKIRKVELADKMGLSYPSILNKIESPGTFKVSELLELCNILNVDINELLIKY